MVRGRIVLVTLGTEGDLNPFIALACELAARGYDPVVASSESHRQKVLRNGLSFHPIRPNVPADPREIRDALEEIRRDHPHDARSVWWSGVLRSFMSMVREQYDDLQGVLPNADLAVINAMPPAFAAPLFCEYSGIPWISIALSPQVLFSVFDPPSEPGYVRGNPDANREHYNRLKRESLPAAKQILDLREELGLTSDKHPLYESRFSDRLTLALFSRVLTRPQPDWPPNVRIVGYPFRPSTVELGGAVSTFLKQGPPPVVFTLGSITSLVDDGRFGEVSAEAARGLGIRALLVLAQRVDGHSEDMMWVDYAPYSALFPHASAVVHQAGIGTLGEVLRAGRPMLAVPSWFDQGDNTVRALRKGVGRFLHGSEYTVDKVTQELGALLSTASYAEKAAKTAEIVRSERGLQKACEAIEEVVGNA